MTRPLIIDCFAGGGGASTGIEMALGRSPDYAINHDPVAVAMHAVNHPDSVHLCQNVYQVDPLDHFNRAHIGFAWFSPDCKHFSKAKGGAPVQRNIRDLAWIIPGWIERIQKSGGRVDVVAIENVEEFQTWGPLLTTDKGLVPDPERKGETFKAWCKKLKQLGGRIEWRELRACDYGAPTIRKRVFIIIRFDGKKIVWPEPSHGKPDSDEVKSGRLQPWLTAGHDVIDWDIACPSIFDTRAMILERYGLRAVRPLADNTMARVARGIKRYVLDAHLPFLVNLTHGARLEGVDDPLRTVTCANRGEKAVVSPTMVSIAHGDSGGRREYPVDEPYHTVTVGGVQHAVVAPSLTRFNSGATGAGMDEPVPTVTANSFQKRPGGAAPLGVVAPVLAGCGGRAGQSRPRGGDEPMATVTAKADTCVAAPHLMTMRNAGKPFQGADEPTHTVTAGGAGLTCVAASLAQTGYGEREGQNPRSLDPAAPLGTVVAGGVKHAPVAAYMAQHNNDSRRIGGVNPGRAADDPVSTVTASGAQQGVVAASMLSMKGSERRASGADEPARVACTGGGQAAVVAAHVTRQFGASVGHDASEPTGTITTDVNKTGVVAGALVKYYGTGDGQEATEPLHTVTTKDRFCLTRAALAAPPFGPEHHERAREVAAFLRAHGFWDEREFVTIDVATDAGMVTLVMVDIGLRMLIPRELFNAQGFPHGYRIDRDLEGRVFSQSDQVGRAGNSVCPPLAEAITRANVPHLAAFAEAAE
ncbi:DNA cytosine methyltransferase [Hoeflea phototrophica]|nr:DNA cytosine methyltransferase [Hoeflea phototrophica]